MKPDIERGGVEHAPDPLADLPQQSDLKKKNLFFRVTLRREDYFSDLAEGSTPVGVETFPTREYHTFLESTSSVLACVKVPLTEDQPTLHVSVPLTEQATQILTASEQTTEIIPGLLFKSSQIQAQTTVPIPPPTAVEPESLSGHLTKLLKSSGVYALASLVNPLVTLILAPFLTRNLSRTDYGILAVVGTLIALVVGLSQLGLSSAFFRAYNYDYETARDRMGVLSTTLTLLICCTIPLTLITFISAGWLADVLLGSASLAGEIQLAALIVLLQNLTVPGLVWMRAENRVRRFTILSIANLLAEFGMTVLLVGVYHLGIAGALFATAFGYALIMLGSLPPVLMQIGKLIPSPKMARELLGFGLPTAFSFAFAWLLQLADRFLLAHMHSLSDAAAYSVAYTLGSALTVVVLAPFSLAWPSTLFRIAKRADARRIFQLIFRWYSLLLLFMAYALTLAGRFVLTVFFPASYSSAATIIPLIALSTMFYGVYNYLTLWMAIRKTIWYATFLIAIAALINIVANLLLIPRWGLQGAALATLIAYALLAVQIYIVNQRTYPIPYEIGFFVLCLSLVIFSYLLGSTVALGHPFWLYWGISCGVLLLCGVALLFLGKLWTSLHPLSGKSAHPILAKSSPSTGYMTRVKE
jgi:O-antigen/teichoic acid export membrane protein